MCASRFGKTWARPVHKAVLEGRADIGLSTPPPISSDLRYRPLLRDEVVLVCRNDDMLAHREEHDWSVFATRAFVILSPETGLRAMIDGAMEEAGVAAEPLFNCNRPTTIGSLVNAGLGISALSRLTLAQLDSPTLAYRKLRNPTVARSIGIVTHAARSLSPAARLFLKELDASQAARPKHQWPAAARRLALINRREMLAGMGAMLAARHLLARRASARRCLCECAGLDRSARCAARQRDRHLGKSRLLVVGDNDRVRKLASRRTRIVDLKGAFVMPGFMDNHTHFPARFASDSARRSCGLRRPKKSSSTASPRSAKTLRPGQWLQGGNWDEQMWGGELPSRQWIDAVTPNTPVAVVRLDQHVALLNSLALQLARIDRNTPDPEGGLIIRDEKGEPTGLIKDKATDLLKTLFRCRAMRTSMPQLASAPRMRCRKASRRFTLPSLDWVTHESLRRLRKANKVGMRFYSFVPLEDWRKLDALVKAEGRGDDWVRWGALKGLVDGSLGSRTAVFQEPYADDPSNHGIYRTPPEKLRELILGADAAGLHITVHAIGDEGKRQSARHVREAIAKNGARDRRFRIEHAQHLLASDVPRFAKLNIIASMQPYHAIDDGRWAIKPLGPERLHTSWAIRSLLDARAKVTFGSDWPVAPIDPLLGVAAAVLRRTIDGANPSGWVPEQKITVQEALTGVYNDQRLCRLPGRPAGTDRAGISGRPHPPGYRPDPLRTRTDHATRRCWARWWTARSASAAINLSTPRTFAPPNRTK